MSAAADADRAFERELVGMALANPELLPEVLVGLSEADFSDRRCGWAWRQLASLVDESAPVDYLSLGARAGPAASAAVNRWAADLSAGFPRATSLEWYARRVRDRATCRLAARAFAALSAEASASSEAGETLDPGLVDKLLTEAARLAERSGDGLQRTDYSDLADAAMDYLRRWGRRDPLAVPTGLWRLDRNLGGGLRRGKLVTFGAMTGGGKTSLVQQVAMFAARAGYRVLFFSLEVEPLDLLVRDVERESRFSKWDRGRYALASGAQEEALGRIMAGARPSVVWGSKVTLAQIRQEVLRYRFKAGGVDLIVLDHAQVVAPGPGEAKELPTYLRIGNTAEALRQMGIRLNAAVAVSSQMNPGPKAREGKGQDARIDKAQTRFGQELPNASDAVVLLHVEWDTAADGMRVVSEAQLVLDKNRLGAMGRLPVEYDAKTYRFSNTAEDQRAADEWEERMRREEAPQEARPEPGPEPPERGLFEDAASEAAFE